MIRSTVVAGAFAGLLLLSLTGMVMASGSNLSSIARDVTYQQETPGRPIVIRWSTETEVDTAGFNIYRSQSEQGPWVQINGRLIPGAPDPLRGGSYVFTDTEVIAGNTYWYELEEIELSGRATRLERTRALAESQKGDLLAGLPCGSSLFAMVSLGIMVIGGRRKIHARA
ncbi:MAG: hypothetical protein U9R25_18245 [Chloroflexota bacterium]|nr:hypothetical protein [Chloroflexota bacterium]